MQEDHPDVDVYIGALDDHLNEHGYIVPGLETPETVFLEQNNSTGYGKLWRLA